MKSDQHSNWTVISGIVQQGHQIASGQALNSPYPQGSIEIQTPYFQALGLDISMCFKGTLNLSIHPYQFVMRHPAYTFRRVHWTTAHPPEDFSFSPCQVIFQAVIYDGFIYYPHPETKIRHFQNSSILEVLAPLIPRLQVGDAVELKINLAEIMITRT